MLILIHTKNTKKDSFSFSNMIDIVDTIAVGNTLSLCQNYTPRFWLDIANKYIIYIWEIWDFHIIPQVILYLACTE